MKERLTDRNFRPGLDDSDGPSYESLYEKLRYYENLEEENRLKIFPLKVGDCIWDKYDGAISSYQVTGFSFGNLNADYEPCNPSRYGLIMWFRNAEGTMGSCAVDSIGRSYFLSREEAKKSLERENRERGKDESIPK